jgi:hypothetical protein
VHSSESLEQIVEQAGSLEGIKGMEAGGTGLKAETGGGSIATSVASPRGGVVGLEGVA